MKMMKDETSGRRGLLARNRHHIALLILFVAWVIGQAQKTAMGVAAIPISKEFGFSSVEVGWILGSFYGSYAAFTFIGGIAADRFGARNTLASMIGLWSLLTGAIGFAWSLPSFIAARFLCGAAEGGFPSASSVAIADLYPVHQRGRAKAFVVSAAHIGSAASTLLVASFIASIGWHYAFWAYAALGLLVAPSFAFVFRARGWRGESRGTLPLRSALREVFRSRLAIVMFIIQFATGTFFFGINSWLPRYWVEVKGLSLLEMGGFTAIAAFAAFILTNISGWIIDQYLRGREKYLIIACLLASAVGLAVMGQAESKAFAFISLSAVQTTTGIASSAVFTIALKYFHQGVIGTATGVANFGQQLAAFIAPVTFGYLIEASGGSYALVFGFAVVTVSIAFCAAFTIDTRDQATAYEVEPAGTLERSKRS